MIPQVLKNAQSINDVVELINQVSACYYKNKLAGQSAWNALEPAEHTTTRNTDIFLIGAHLDILLEAEAVFDYDKALAVALKIKQET